MVGKRVHSPAPLESGRIILETASTAGNEDALLMPAAHERALRTQLLARTLRQQLTLVVNKRRLAEARSGGYPIRKK